MAGVPRTVPAALSDSVIVARRVGYVLLGVQLVAMIAFSSWLYQRFSLSQDYSQYAQAWYAIAHGHLNPWDSVNHYAFWQNHAEFVLWPLALLYFVFPHAIDLLWVQDLAVVGTEVVAFRWAIAVLAGFQPHLTRRGEAFAILGIALTLVADPWAYNTAAFDFHSATIAGLFVILAGRELWLGPRKRLTWWVVGALISESLAGFFIAAVGISGLCTGQGRRRSGAVLLVLGVGWVVALTLLAGHIGNVNISHNYGYLVRQPSRHTGILAVAAGVVLHPGAVLSHIAARWEFVLVYMGAVGLIGVVSPWVLPMAVVVFFPSLLAVNPDFIGLFETFQQWPALPFVLVGSVMVLGGLRRHGHMTLLRAAIAVWAALVLVLAVTRLPDVVPSYLAVHPSAARTLADIRTEIPPEAEVIGSQGIVGRFSDRRDVQAIAHSYEAFPIAAHTVIFIISAKEGYGEVPPSSAHAAIRTVEHLGARQFVDRAGIDAFIWHPDHERRIVLP